MINEFNLIKILINRPFAIFQEKICIFESNINDTYVWESFSKNIWHLVVDDEILLKYFRGLIFVAIKYKRKEVNYLLVVIIHEKETIQWLTANWEDFYLKISSAVMILKNQKKYKIRKMTETDSLNLPDDVKETLSEKEIENTQDYVDNYQLENLFMNQLKSENIVASNQMLNHLIKINQSKLAKNELQEKKYRLVSLITVITRAAIKQGCTPNLAYRLSDQLIQKMDAIEHSREFSTFLKSLILEFSVLLQTRGTKYNSEVVNTAIEYISRNLYQPISNEDIANYVGVNTNYLSSIFKKETNIALHQYLLEARVNEAQYLLSHTDIAFKDISEILQFSNQSHFGKIFKSKTMYTPKEFRILF